MPLLSFKSVKIAPRYSFGNNKSTSQILSCNFFISVYSSRIDGFLITLSSSLFLISLNSTDGGVTIRDRSNSLSNRSITISKCKRPKNPHLNPNPKAEEVSGSKTKLASFNTYLSNDSLSFVKSSESEGNILEKTVG